MAGKTVDIYDVIEPDNIAREIAEKWNLWNNMRSDRIAAWDELRRYLFATDTTTTTNHTLPWKNKTHLPKITQIRDNLYANYMAAMFPRRKWLEWASDTKADQDKDKVEAIEGYMGWVVDKKFFKSEVSKLTLDYIDYGNCFAMPVWLDNRTEVAEQRKAGYAGPALQRISPLDIVFNPIARTFEETPKIVKELFTLGELKKFLTRLSNDANEQAEYEEIFQYLRKVRHHAATGPELVSKDAYLNVDGYASYQEYLESNYVEVLTFYGDMYLEESGELLENHIIVVVDRHKLITNRPNPNMSGTSGIFHAGWRVRQDNLWAMGPLDNLVGLQYRIDHLENLKADLMDISVFPILKVKGYVEDFNWEPMERIYVGDDGDVEPLAISSEALNVNFELDTLKNEMEAMAGAPREAMGFRTPGEKTRYEVQRLENAAARLFQSKIAQFEEHALEQWLNAMLELARLKIDPITIRVLNDEDFRVASFMEITADDLSGAGRIRPTAARHFVENAERLQNLSNWYASGVGSDPSVIAHISGEGIAKLSMELLDLDKYNLYQPNVRVLEEMESQSLANQGQIDNAMSAQQPTGLTADDIVPEGM